MRWDNLFDDLEGQLEQEISAEEVDLQAEEERLRLARLSLRDRILSIHEAHERSELYSISIELRSGEGIEARPLTFGRDWFSADLIDSTARRTQCVVPLAGIAALTLKRSQIPESLTGAPGEVSGRSLAARLSLSFVLRDLCRRRATVELRTSSGSFTGTLDRVGRDHLDIAVHEANEPRRDANVVQYRVVPLEQLVLIRIP